MSTISVRLNDEEARLIREYTTANGLNMSAFIRNTVIDAIEEHLQLDEERILNALQQSKQESTFTHDEMMQELGL